MHRRLPPPRAASACAFALVALVALVAGCASDGTTLRDPLPGATTAPPRASTTTTAGAVIAPAPGQVAHMVLASTAFVDGASLPATLSCDAAGPTSPGLAWTDVPASAVELAVTVVDPDAGGYVHWAVVGIAPTVRSFDAGKVPEGATELPTDDGGKAGWAPVCPPKGAGVHRYVFTLYALTKRTALAPGATGRQAIDTLEATAVATATLAGTFSR